jgi:cellobiose phosphorylase
MVQTWKFTNQHGEFELPDPHHSSYLYFPLVNEAGMISSISPTLHGDIKSGHHTFLTPPVSVEDLHNSRAGRNFWLHVENAGAWSVTGNAAPQIAQNFSSGKIDQVTLRAGFLWHQIVRKNERFGLQAEITNLVPPAGDQVELMQVQITNISDQPVQFTPTAAIPIFGRSADNLRDHRHVTSLLHRITCARHGILVHPTLSFDERGHHPNHTIYAVLGAEGDGAPPEGFFPIVEDFIGEGGSLDWPEAVVRPIRECVPAGRTFDGYEAFGGLRFGEVRLLPGESRSYILILAIISEEKSPQDLLETYGSQEKFAEWLEKTKAYWQRRLEHLGFQSGDVQHDLWLKWVCLQPILRREMGNSFLPFHDYGRGGRGWRDLWQDILALLIIESGQVDHMLFENFAGVRLDGSNATIIGSRPGEFRADRNNIPRVWMDHGAWPLLTTLLYIDQTGDLNFLLRNQVYFKDHLIERAQSTDADWEPTQGTRQLTRAGDVYQGTILEHLLVQHLTAFFNVGEHNHIKLEGADWNDGMDMAAQRGESVAFSALYASNLHQISKLLEELRNSGHEQVELAAEILFLLDTLQNPIDYLSVKAKQQRLQEYFAVVAHTLSGEKVAVPLADLAEDLSTKADWMMAHIRQQEWISHPEGYGWFNGYYDNDGQQLEGSGPDRVRITLTGQVFTLMGGIATDEQANQIIQAVDRYLFDPGVGGYRLNSDFQEVLLNMGRCFGFAYGHKENGAMFSHMAVMYAYALYQRGFVNQAHRALAQIYRHSVNFQTSRMYPGIPEYFNDRGRGVYTYLTGSASWYLLTLLTQAFGVRGQTGDLVLAPKLVAEQFDAEGQAGVLTRFADLQMRVIFHNTGRLNYGAYRIVRVTIDGNELLLETPAESVRIARQHITALEPDHVHEIRAWLGAI